MIYKTSLSDIIQSFNTVTIMQSKDMNRFHSNNTVKNVNISSCNLYGPNLIYIGFTKNSQTKNEAINS